MTISTDSLTEAAQAIGNVTSACIRIEWLDYFKGFMFVTKRVSFLLLLFFLRWMVCIHKSKRWRHIYNVEKESFEATGGERG